MIACQSSSFMRSSNWSRVMPALLIRIETEPNSFAIASIRPSTAAPSVTFSTRPWPPCAASRSPIAAAPPSLVAVPITVAPITASSSAIAAPMPRLAPVTSAISPCSGLLMDRSFVNRKLCSGPLGAGGVEFGRGADRPRLDALVEALDQAGQHLARTEFGDARGTAGGQCLHAFGPAYRQVQLALQRAADLVERGVALCLGVLDHRNRRQPPVDRGHALAQAIGGATHQHAVRGH